MKKIKKNRDEKLKTKKKHRSQLPPLSEKDILRIKQLSSKQLNPDRERSSQDDRIEEQQESVSLNFSSVIATRVAVESVANLRLHNAAHYDDGERHGTNAAAYSLRAKCFVGSARRRR